MLDQIISEVELQIAEDTARRHFMASFLSCMREEQVGAERAIEMSRAVMEQSITHPEARIMPDGYTLPDDVLVHYQQQTRALFDATADSFRESFQRMRDLVGIDTAFRIGQN